MNLTFFSVEATYYCKHCSGPSKVVSQQALDREGFIQWSNVVSRQALLSTHCSEGPSNVVSQHCWCRRRSHYHGKTVAGYSSKLFAARVFCFLTSLIIGTWFQLYEQILCDTGWNGWHTHCKQGLCCTISCQQLQKGFQVLLQWEAKQGFTVFFYFL